LNQTKSNQMNSIPSPRTQLTGYHTTSNWEGG
jgi:hypothetical protein